MTDCGIVTSSAASGCSQACIGGFKEWGGAMGP